MPTTPTYNLPFPAEGDTVDVPADLRALAEAVELALAAVARSGVPGPAGVQGLQGPQGPPGPPGPTGLDTASDDDAG